MNDLEQLIAAWIRWEDAPSSPAAADGKEDALDALEGHLAAVLDQQGVRQ